MELIHWLLRQRGMGKVRGATRASVATLLPPDINSTSWDYTTVGTAATQRYPSQTMVMNAAFRNNVEVVQVLLEHGARIDVPPTLSVEFYIDVLMNPDYNNILRQFVTKGGLDVNASLIWMNTSAPTLLLQTIGSAYEGKAETVRTLVELGADVNKCNANGATPMFFAGQTDCLEAAVILAAAGADIHRPKLGGCTPLVRDSFIG